MSNPSKEKGNRYEYKVRDILTEHFGVKFERVPTSGALEWMKGDLFVPESAFPYTIECKSYAEIDFNSLLTAKSNDLYSFWTQVTTDAKHMKKMPLLCFKWNYSKNYCAFEDMFDLEPQLVVSGYGHKFKIALLDSWLERFGKKF